MAQDKAVFDSDTWGRERLAWLTTMPSARREAWTALLEHCATTANKSRPTKRWETQAAPLVANVGDAEVNEVLRGWMESIPLGPTESTMWPDVPLGTSEGNRAVLKGLVWSAMFIDDATLGATIGSFAERCFRKIPVFGAASTKLGNASLITLGRLPGVRGVAALSRLMGKIRYASAKRVVERALNETAERTGTTREELEEIGVPDFETVRIALAEFTAELTIDDGQAVLRWIKPNGKPQKSVPKAVKEQHSDEVKQLTKRRKELDELLEGQALRLERMWLADRRLPAAKLVERYLKHPIVGTLARRLVWVVGDKAVTWQDGRFIGVTGNRVEIADDAQARLWHPLDLESADELLVWRDRFLDLGIRQPFKQLWREVFAPQDPDATIDERLAGHILRQHALAGMAQRHGWQYQIQGYFDSHNLPTRDLPRWNLSVEFQADPVRHDSDDYLFSYLLSGAIRFLRDHDPVALGEVPAIVFSEVMRDIDWFISSSSVANDPTWDGRAEESWSEYWDRGAWGDLAPAGQTRRAIVEHVLPRTTLREHATLDEQWLVVQGPGGPYRVHLGSGNVRRDGSDAPLVLKIGKREREQVADVFLPFEGDGMLTDIFARAFILSAKGAPAE